jgi:hypothetical protein
MQPPLLDEYLSHGAIVAPGELKSVGPAANFAYCNHLCCVQTCCMSEALTPTALSIKAGISVPYASQILSDKPKQARTPSRSLAIHIFRKTGWRHDSIAALSDAEIDVLERLEPWASSAERAA